MSSPSAVPGLLELSHLYLSRVVRPGDTVLDCTLGNGHDTLFLADLVEEQGHVYAFDVQKEALSSAAQLLAGYSNVTFFLAGHEALAQKLPHDLKGKISAAMFNLGYLPGSDKSVITSKFTTLAALDLLLDWLAPGGGISIHIYMGHPGGLDEGVAVLEWAQKIPREWGQAAVYEVLNKTLNREALLLIGKK